MKSQYEVSELLEQIQNKVAERRIHGLYPPGLEQQLEREFAEIMSATRRTYFVSDELKPKIDHLEVTIRNLSGLVSTSSRIPGVSLLHWFVGKIAKRQILGLTAQIRDVEAQVLVVLNSLGEFAESQESADHRVVRQLTQHVLDRMAVVDHLAILTVELESRIHSLEANLGK